MKDFFKCHLSVLKVLKLFRKIKKLEYFGGVRYLLVLILRPGPPATQPTLWLLCVQTNFFTAPPQSRADTASTEANTTFEYVSETE